MQKVLPLLAACFAALLDSYVASFSDGGSGSEFYRLAVEAVDEARGRHTVWEGEDPLTEPGVFEATIWNEIDAVEIVGPDGRAWASKATASSTYGQ